MWCSDCEQDFSIVDSAEIQICPNCQKAAKAGGRQRRVPHLNPPQSKRRYRIDTAHQPIPVVDKSAAEIELIAKAGPWLTARSLTHAIVFGLFVFLLGQSVLAWAFLTGNYIAWSVANLLSVFGITIAFVAVAITMRNFERRIQNLARLVGRTRNTRMKRRPSKKAGKE